MKKELTLNLKTDFTPSQLKNFLEKKFIKKTSGKKFTNQDIYSYAKRGNLPKIYGGNSIQILDFKETSFYRLLK